PVWVGSATFDERVGLSHTTGQITHHIGPDVDAERDLIMTGLKKAGWVQREFTVDGFHQNPEGRNGGGDLWRTDGRLGAIVLRPDRPQPQPA
ncbi:MAG: LssY C-terminal domain-containing protein, partial [Terrimicrobiaceae bacterium]